jgi:hypothetical protein
MSRKIFTCNNSRLPNQKRRQQKLGRNLKKAQAKIRIAGQVTIRWTQNNHFSNVIYLTDERWEHIIDGNNHPEMAGFEEYLKKTIRLGTRKQDPLNPHKYRYTKKC